jgi:two-component system, OmpR family, KDP operon response regulator KdpE
LPRRRIVLLVEPDPAARDGFATALQARGFEVLAAPDGATARQLVRSGRPGVVIGDFPLGPDCDFTKAVLADAGPGQPLIVTVTDRMLTEKHSAAWQMSDRVLAKPIDPERLTDEVVWMVERTGPSERQPA